MARNASLAPVRVKGRKTPWCVAVPPVMSETGKRERRFFPTKAQAQTFVEQTQTRVLNQGVSANGLSSIQREVAAAALRLLGDEPPATDQGGQAGESRKDVGDGKPDPGQDDPEKVDHPGSRDHPFTHQLGVHQPATKREGGKPGNAKGCHGKGQADHCQGEQPASDNPQSGSKDAAPKDEPEKVEGEFHGLLIYHG